MQPLSSTPPHSEPSSSPLKKIRQPSDKSEYSIAPSTSPRQEESIDISQAGQEIKQYVDTLADLPDIRQERITQIQKALADGTYSVSSTQLANKLIQELSPQKIDPSSTPS